MTHKWLMAMWSAALIAIPAGIAVAQPGTYDGRSGYGQSQGYPGRGGSGDWDRDRDGRDGRGYDRDDWRRRHSRRDGPVSIRNYKHYPVYVQLRDSRGISRSSFRLNPGERRYSRVDADSRWTVYVRQYKSYRRYEIDSIGHFDDGRWNVRIR